MKRECLTIIGTAHVSQSSVEEVKNTIIEKEPDVVAVELCYSRFLKLQEERFGNGEEQNISIKEIIKDNNVGIFLASTLLSYFQNKIGDDLGVKPGSEMMAAIEAAEEVGAKVALIDRDINITLKRVMNQMTLKEKLKFVVSLIGSIFTDDESLEDIENLKKEDTLQEVMEYFKEVSPTAYNALVSERDAYLAAKILEIGEDKVIAVVGAGHKPGINRYLDNPEDLPPLSSLETIDEKKGIPWLKIILFLIPVLFILIFFLSIINGININANLTNFILLTGTLAFLGSILSGSKIQSAIVAFIVAPLTVIHPLLAAGWFSGIVEAKYRHITSSDLTKLTKTENFKDLWNNNLFRVLLVVIGTNLGATLATFISIPNIFLPMLSKLMSLGLLGFVF